MNFFNRFGIVLCIACLALFAIACGGDDDDDPDTTNTADMTGSDTTADTPGMDTTNPPGGGVTQCGDFATCQAGQYCEDPIFSMCTNGCLNNDNCLSDQTCIKEGGANEGTCQNNVDPPMGATLEQVCTKLLACDPSGTQAQCEQIYNGTNDTCHDCLANVNCPDLINNDACATECGF